MASERKRNRIDPQSNGDPLSAAVSQRDRSALDMVRTALDHKQVMLAYQPVMASTGGVAFYDGLIRVLDETGRIIPAREFINVIEETEMGRIIDCLALEKGMRALSKNPTLRLSVNMSARSIGYGRWKKVLERNLRTDPTLDERLIMEITETSAMLVPELVISFMAELQERGVCFALNDFGAGYTSFRYLRDFYFDMIKIDGQFIRGISIQTTKCLCRRLSRLLSILTCSLSQNLSRTCRTRNFWPRTGSTACKGITSVHPQCAPLGAKRTTACKPEPDLARAMHPMQPSPDIFD